MYYYSSAEIDEDLKCSFCEEKFSGVVKLVPECGESVCGACYDEISEESARQSKFECRACGRAHTMPPSGLPDCNGLARILKRRKVEKPLSESAKLLKFQVDSVQRQLATLKSFDEKNYVNQHCDRLETQVAEAVGSVVKQLAEFEADLLKQIRDYRERCLDDLCVWSPRKELDVLSAEIDNFSRKWSEFFTRIDVMTNESDVHWAQVEARSFEKRMKALENRLKDAAFKGGRMELRVDSHSFSSLDSLKQAICLTVQTSKPGEIRIREKPVQTLAGDSSWIRLVLFLPDSRLVSCSENKTIKIWNVSSGTLLSELEGHADWVFCLALLSNGWLASGSRDKTVKVWDLACEREVRTLAGATCAVVSLKALKNGQLAGYSLDEAIRIWNPYVDESSLLLTITGHKHLSVPFGVLSNDNLVACSWKKESRDDCVLKVWRSRDGRLVRQALAKLSAASTMLVLSDDRVALGSQSGTIRMVDLTADARSKTKTRAHRFEVKSLAQLSSGALVSCGEDGDLSFWSLKIKVWNTQDFSLSHTLATDLIVTFSSLCISPDEEFMAIGAKSIKLWSITSE